MLPVMSSNSWFPTIFNDFFNDEWMTVQPKTTAPAVNVIENVKDYTMEMAVPGIKKEFCRVNINADGNLEVAIENKLEHKGDKKERYLRREFNYTNYQQTYVLPDDIVKDEITAKVENGVLTVVIPKVMTSEQEKKVQRQIEIG